MNRGELWGHPADVGCILRFSEQAKVAVLMLLTNAVSPGRNRNPKSGSVNLCGALMGKGGRYWPGLKVLLPAADKRISKHVEEFLCSSATKKPFCKNYILFLRTD
jgi:hypothetical protein